MTLIPLFQPPADDAPEPVTDMTVIECIVALAAQHCEDICRDCECPRCCLACRAIGNLLLPDRLQPLYGKALIKLGIEGHPWQNPESGFDAATIAAGWHVPCPVYRMMEEEGDASGQQEHREDRDGEHSGGGPEPAPPEAGMVG